MPPPRICRVCNGKAVSAHFGVDSCRACAAFFKRTVLLKRTYICRQSTDNCDISSEVRFTCRQCRIRKCMAVGMNPLSVPTTPSVRVSDEDWMNKTTPEAESNPHRFTEFEATYTPKGLLDIIKEQYRLLEQIATRNDECVMRAALGDRLQRSVIQHAMIPTGPLPATMGLQHQCVGASNQPMIDFLTRCFPDIHDFNEDDKWLIIKNFMTSRFIFDGVHRAQKAFPGNERMYMVTFHTFVDIDNLEYYLTDLDSIMDKQHALSVMREMTSECTCDWLGPLLTRAKLDEMEVAAVYGLLTCPSYLKGGSARVMEFCYKYHITIFKELHNHYKKKGIADYTSRIANLNSILLSVQGAVERLKEDMHIYRLLDVYRGNELEYKVVT